MFKIHRTFNINTGVKNNSIAVINNPGHIQVIYHETIVVEAIRKTKKASSNEWFVTLNNGGWDTISTRIVINRALEQLPGFGRSYFLYRKKNKTCIQIPFSDATKDLEFISGMELN